MRSWLGRTWFGRRSWHGTPAPLDDVEVANHSRCTTANLKVGPSQRVVDLVNVIADVDGACPAVEADRVDVLDCDAVRTGALDHVEDVRLERRQPNPRAQFRHWLLTMGAQLRHAAPPSASWRRSASDTGSGTGRSLKRMEVVVSPVLAGVKRLPAEVEPGDCLTPAARLISAASPGVGRRIRRNTPSS